MSATDTVTLTRAMTSGGEDSHGADPAPEVVIPRQLGAVNLIKEIGKGGMGVVWLGKHTLLNRDVAVKFLLNVPQSDDDPNFAGFVEGARAAAAFRHKGLNAVVHADAVDSVPYIVMEFVEGPTLARVLHRAGKLSPVVTRVILESVCDAVGELHDRGFIHRDIKPANIILAPDGTPVLTDFGLACQRPVQTLGAKVEAVTGTPAYMAPEMFDKTVSARSDVYAIGIMAFEMMIGFPPFDGPLAMVRHAHQTQDIPRERLALVPPPVVQLIERACNKAPMYRYKSARHMLRAVEEAFGQLDQMQTNKARGEADLTALIARITRVDFGRGDGDKADASGTPAPQHEQTYYDRLGTLVESRRKGSDAATPTPVDQGITPDDLVERITADTQCARCGFNLKGQPLTARCPECLLLVRLTLEPGASSYFGATPKKSGTNLPPEGITGQPAAPESSVSPAESKKQSARAKPAQSTPATPPAPAPGFFRSVRQWWKDMFTDGDR